MGVTWLRVRISGERLNILPHGPRPMRLAT